MSNSINTLTVIDDSRSNPSDFLLWHELERCRFNNSSGSLLTVDPLGRWSDLLNVYGLPSDFPIVDPSLLNTVSSDVLIVPDLSELVSDSQCQTNSVSSILCDVLDERNLVLVLPHVYGSFAVVDEVVLRDVQDVLDTVLGHAGEIGSEVIRRKLR